MHRSTRRPTHRAAAALSALALAAVAACGTADPAAPDGAPSLKKGGIPANPAKDDAKGDDGNGALPARYVLPGAAVFPEGIAYDQRGGGTVYVTSTTDGTIFCGDAKADVLAACFPGGVGGRTTAIGIDVGKAGQLFVAGGATGRVFVVGPTGAPLASLVGASGTTFVNDVAVVGGDTAYVTDSQNPVIYRVYRSASGAYVLDQWLPLANTAITYERGFNLNGIAATPDGRTLYVVQSNTGRLFRIDVATRTVTAIAVTGGLLTNGDGLEVRGNTLYVVRNAQGTIVEVRLSDDGTTGTVVGTTTDASFRYPTTFVEARGRFLVVNSQFDRRAPGLTPEVPFTVSVIKQF
jgi:Cu-Zn family superoxide dismutase